MPIKFRLKELIAERERTTNRRITYRDIQRATGINLNTLTAMANNDMSMVGLSTVERLTDYFDCGIDELMVKEEVMAPSFTIEQFSGTRLTRPQIKKFVKQARRKGKAVSFRKADLSGLDLSGLDLREVDFANADFREADLSAADLSGANLSSARLIGADLSRAILDGTILAWADLTDANLTGADTDQADLYSAII